MNCVVILLFGFISVCFFFLLSRWFFPFLHIWSKKKTRNKRNAQWIRKFTYQIETDTDHGAFSLRAFRSRCAFFSSACVIVMRIFNHYTWIWFLVFIRISSFLGDIYFFHVLFSILFAVRFFFVCLFSSIIH